MTHQLEKLQGDCRACCGGHASTDLADAPAQASERAARNSISLQSCLPVVPREVAQKPPPSRQASVAQAAAPLRDAAAAGAGGPEQTEADGRLQGGQSRAPRATGLGRFLSRMGMASETVAPEVSNDAVKFWDRQHMQVLECILPVLKTWEGPRCALHARAWLRGQTGHEGVCLSCRGRLRMSPLWQQGTLTDP